MVLVAKKSKTGDPGSSPSFWHLVKTGKPEPGASVYNNNFLIIYILNINISIYNYLSLLRVIYKKANASITVMCTWFVC